MTDWNNFFEVVEQLCVRWSVSPESRFLWIYQMILLNRARIERSWWQHQCLNSVHMFQQIVERVMPDNEWNEPVGPAGFTTTYRKTYVQLLKANAFRKLAAEQAA